ncbi:DUF6089 family protein [Bacteroidales bacterium OttesenSCG-928-M06]|nr:DUF6089 family protein [Bacteroidales bacterium OttesenSCG-928-M06]
MNFASKKRIINKSVFFLILYFFFCVTAVAQEYRYEVGGMAGTSMYMGDANPISLGKGWNPAGGLIFRNNLNFRWALKADLMMGRITGNTTNTDNVFPYNSEASFSRNFFELGGQIEFNFLPYSDKFAYLNTSKVTPYIFTGLGVTFAPGKGRNFFGINLPLGVGVKYKLKNRLNLGLEWAVHKLFSDSFDTPYYPDGFGLDNPYKIDSSIFKNKDWYNTILLSVTWEFGLRDGRCM